MFTSVGVGAVLGMLVFALWWFTEWTRLCLFLDSLFLGFLVGATLMFTPFGKNLEEFDRILPSLIFTLISVTFNLKLFANFLRVHIVTGCRICGTICLMN